MVTEQFVEVQVNQHVRNRIYLGLFPALRRGGMQSRQHGCQTASPSHLRTHHGSNCAWAVASGNPGRFFPEILAACRVGCEGVRLFAQAQ